MLSVLRSWSSRFSNGAWRSIHSSSTARNQVDKVIQRWVLWYRTQPISVYGAVDILLESIRMESVSVNFRLLWAAVWAILRARYIPLGNILMKRSPYLARFSSFFFFLAVV